MATSNININITKGSCVNRLLRQGVCNGASIFSKVLRPLKISIPFSPSFTPINIHSLAAYFIGDEILKMPSFFFSFFSFEDTIFLHSAVCCEMNLLLLLSSSSSHFQPIIFIVTYSKKCPCIS